MAPYERQNERISALSSWAASPASSVSASASDAHARWLRWRFAALLLVYVAVAAAYSVLVPLWEAPDEPEHYQYIRYLRISHQLPAGPLPSIQLDGNEESNQPPLYYTLGAIVTWWLGDDRFVLHPNPYLTWGPGSTRNAYIVHTVDESFPYHGAALGAHATRLLSTAMGAVTVWATYRLALAIFPAQTSLALGAAALTAFRPGFLASAAAINNDNAAGMFGSLAFLVLAHLWRRGLDRRWLVALGVVFGLAVLSKENSLTLAPAVFLWPIAMAGRGAMIRRALASTLGAAGWVGGSAALISGWWFARNLLVYGVLIRKEYSRTFPLTTLSPLRFGEAAQGYLATFWGSFGWGQVYLSPRAYTILGVLTILALVGLGLALYRLRRTRQFDALIWLLFAIVVTIGAVDFQRQLTQKVGTDHARFWLPVIAPLSLLIWIGVVEWARRLRALLAPALMAAALTSFGLVLPVLVVSPAFPAPLPVRTSIGDWTISHPVSATYGGQIRLAGYDAPTTARPGETLSVDLYWEARSAMTSDYSVFIHVADAAGRPQAQRDGPLGTLDYPTSRWQVGDAVQSHVTIPIPESIAPGQYRLLVGIYRLDEPLRRLPVDAVDLRVENDALQLTSVEIAPSH